MARVIANWLQGYQTYTREHESPDTYHLWTGLWVMASALRRNLFLNQGTYLLYPNLYIVLVAPPGEVRKSSGMKLGKRLLHDVPGVKFGPDSVTTEKLINLMKVSYESNQSSMTIASSEMSSLIMPSGISMIQFLTDVYECDYDNPVGWKYSTKGKGEDIIKNPCLNLLACTTPSWIAEGLPMASTEHGFTSRVIFVYEEEPRHFKARPSEPEPILVEALVNDLQHIAQLEGTFDMSPEADEWYEDRYPEIRKTKPADRRLATYYSRKDTHILKVAMLMHLAEGDDLMIEVRDLESALGLLEMTEEKMHKAFSALGKYEFASEMEHVYNQILSEGGSISQSAIYDKFYHVGPANVQQIIEGLRLMGRVNVVRQESGWVLQSQEQTPGLGTGGRTAKLSKVQGRLWDYIGAGGTAQLTDQQSPSDADQKGSSEEPRRLG